MSCGDLIESLARQRNALKEKFARAKKRIAELESGYSESIMAKFVPGEKRKPIICVDDYDDQSGWIEITDNPKTWPDVGRLVFLNLQKQIIVCGSRIASDGEWFWARGYGSLEWFHGKWECIDLEMDDIQPTHWHELPEPPKGE